MREPLILFGHFFLHVVVGSLLFVALVFAAVLLHWFLKWVEAQGMADWTTVLLTYCKGGLLILDVVLFVLYMVKLAVTFWHELFAKEA